MTFVYTKLELERATPGDVIKVILDYPPAFENVPRSVRLQRLGTVLSCEDNGKQATVWIRKV